MEEFLREAHSGLRWLVVLMTVIAFGWLIFGLLQKRLFDKMTHRVVVIWSGLVGLQWIIGLIFFIVLGMFDVGYQWEHLTTMTLALAAAHAYVPLKKRPDRTRYIGILASIVVVALLVYIGVARLPYDAWAMGGAAGG